MARHCSYYPVLMDEITFHLLPPGAKWCHYPSYSILIRVIYFHHIFILYGNPPRGYLLTDWRSMHVSIARNIEHRHKFQMCFNPTSNSRHYNSKNENICLFKACLKCHIFVLFDNYFPIFHFEPTNKGIVKGMKRDGWHFFMENTRTFLIKSMTS